MAGQVSLSSGTYSKMYLVLAAKFSASDAVIPSALGFDGVPSLCALLMHRFADDSLSKYSRAVAIRV